MEGKPHLITDAPSNASTSNFFGMTQQLDFRLCNLCDLVVHNALLPDTRNSAETLDERFYTYFSRVMEDFRDTYKDLDNSVPLFEKAFTEMNKFTISNVMLDVPQHYAADPLYFRQCQRSYRDHIRHSCSNLIADLGKMRSTLDSCFFIHHQIIQINQGGILKEGVFESVMQRSRNLLEIIAKNTYSMRQKLAGCKRDIQQFYELKENVLHHYFWT